jgi:hypothetical protein
VARLLRAGGGVLESSRSEKLLSSDARCIELCLRTFDSSRERWTKLLNLRPDSQSDDLFCCDKEIGVDDDRTHHRLHQFVDVIAEERDRRCLTVEVDEGAGSGERRIVRVARAASVDLVVVCGEVELLRDLLVGGEEERFPASRRPRMEARTIQGCDARWPRDTSRTRARKWRNA